MPRSADPEKLRLHRRALVDRTGATRQQIADVLRCSQPFASDLINGHERSAEKERRFAAWLSEQLGGTYRQEDLFPPNERKPRS